jgi:hypothetical protein
MAKINAPESLGGDSQYLQSSKENEGFYLFTVVDAHEDKYPTKDGFESFDGVCAECDVVGGPNDGKRFNLKLWYPKMTSKDEGKSASQKIFAFLVATDVVTPDKLGQEIEFDMGDSVGSMFFVDLRLGNENDKGKQYLEVYYSNIYHVDDPRAAKIKIDDAQKSKIANVKPSYRHPKDYFAKLVAKKENNKSVEKPNFDDL